MLSRLTIKIPSKICSRQHFFKENVNLDISCESSAGQLIHMRCQDLFSQKNKNKIKIVVNHSSAKQNILATQKKVCTFYLLIFRKSKNGILSFVVLVFILFNYLPN